MKYLFEKVRGHAGALVVSVILSLVLAVASILPAQLTQEMIDMGFMNGDPDHIFRPAVLIGLLALMQGVLSFCVTALSSYVGESVAAAARGEIAERLLGLPVNFQGEKSSTYLVSRFGEAGKISSLFSPTVYTFFSGIIQAGIAFALLLHTDGRLTLLLLLPAPLFVAFSLFSIRSFRAVIEESLEASAEYNGKMNEVIRARETIRVTDTIKEAYSATEQYNCKMKNKGVRQSIMLGISTETLKLLSSILVAYAYIVCGIYLVGGGEMTAGTAVMCASYAGRLYVPLVTVGAVAVSSQPAFTAIKRIQETFFSHTMAQTTKGASIAKVQSIDACNLSYRYNGSHAGFGPLSFSVQSPGIYLIKGGNGSGKSTLSKVLLKVIGCYEGSLRINGVELSAISEPSFRKHVSSVSQHPFLFEMSVRDNILYGVRHPDEEQYKEIMQALNLNRIIDDLPSGDQTMVSEGGKNLSGGTRQKISLARALVRGSDMLVLDEPFNNLDKDSIGGLVSVLTKASLSNLVVVIDHSGILDGIATQKFHLSSDETP